MAIFEVGQLVRYVPDDPDAPWAFQWTGWVKEVRDTGVTVTVIDSKRPFEFNVAAAHLELMSER